MKNLPFSPTVTNASVGDTLFSPLFDIGFDTRDEVISLIPAYVAVVASQYASQYLVDDAVLLSVLNSLSRTADAETLAFGHARLPSDAIGEDTIRFNIAYLHESALGMPSVISKFEADIYHSADMDKYLLRAKPEQTRHVEHAVSLWSRRAMSIMNIMRDATSRVPARAQDAEFIRDAARITLGEIPGLHVVTAANPVDLGYVPATGEHAGEVQFYQMSENTDFRVARLDGAQNVATGDMHNQKDGISVTARHNMAAVKIKSKSAKTWHTEWLAQDATRRFSVADLKKEIQVVPLLPPSLETPMSNITMEAPETRSVNLGHVFSGERLTYSAITAHGVDVLDVSINTKIPAVVLKTGPAATGSMSVEVTAKNEAGIASARFTVTV